MLYRHQHEVWSKLSCHSYVLLVTKLFISCVPAVINLCVSFSFVVGLNDSMSGGMQLLPDALFSIPTDNTYILSITSTDLGRIFMAGKDGCLYEIAYQAEAGWLSQRCRKINHSKSSLSFLVPSVLQFSFSEDGEERDTVICGKMSLVQLHSNMWCPCAPQTPLCRLLLTTRATHYSHALRKVFCRYDVWWMSSQYFFFMWLFLRN